MQVFELFVHLPVPGGLGVEAEIANGGFHIRSGTGLWLRRAHGAPCLVTTSVGDGVRNARGTPVTLRPLRRP
jgi:hypothetical protein